MRRFMLSQANKLRAVDDGRFSGHNKSCFSGETIYTTKPDFVAAACKVCLEYVYGEMKANCLCGPSPILARGI